MIIKMLELRYVFSRSATYLLNLKFRKLTRVTVFLQLAGVVAVEVTGGPSIDFVPGRKVQDTIASFNYLDLFPLYHPRYYSQFFVPGLKYLSEGRKTSKCHER